MNKSGIGNNYYFERKMQTGVNTFSIRNNNYYENYKSK